MKEDQLREDQRREALARKDESHVEETLPPPPVAQHVETSASAPETPAPPRVDTPPRPPVEAPRIDSKELLESAGLVMIETDRAKAPAQPQPEEAPQLGRPRRERAKPAQQEDELQQVETRK